MEPVKCDLRRRAHHRRAVVSDQWLCALAGAYAASIYDEAPAAPGARRATV